MLIFGMFCFETLNIYIHLQNIEKNKELMFVNVFLETDLSFHYKPPDISKLNYLIFNYIKIQSASNYLPLCFHWGFISINYSQIKINYALFYIN